MGIFLIVFAAAATGILVVLVWVNGYNHGYLSGIRVRDEFEDK